MLWPCHVERMVLLTEPVSFRSRLTREDWDAYLAACVARVGSQSKGRRVNWTAIVLGLALAVAVLNDSIRPLALAFVVGLGACAAFFYQMTRRQAEKLSPAETGAFCSVREIEVSAMGIRVASEGMSNRYGWSAFEAFTLTETHLFLWLDTQMAEVIPVAHLPAALEHRDFSAWLKEQIPNQPLTPESLPHLGSEGSPRVGDDGVLRSWQLLGAGMLCALAWVLIDRLAQTSPATLTAYGLPGMVWYALPTLLTAWILAGFLGGGIGFRRVATWLLCLYPLLLAVMSLSAFYPEVSWLPTSPDSRVWWLVLFAGLVVLSWALTRRLQLLPAVAAVACVAGFVWLDRSVYVMASVWFPAESTEEAAAYEDEWTQSEAVLFWQASRIDEQLATLSFNDVAPRAVFLGFAGYGEEKVFAEEIRFAAAAFEDRFPTQGRTLLLVNDRRSQEAPIASVTGLEYSLQALAGRMDLEEDLLILALSSHGASTPALSVSNGMLPLQDLDGRTLRTALDDAGIKWRLLVVSACYSGAFIDELADPRTAIVTAAAPDRTSFGCSNDRDLTYFGEAFYRDALPEAATLPAAFETARQLLLERETAAGYTHSDPRLFIGEAIADRLETMMAPAGATSAD
ncbi:MAG: C13 family peptidase [Pseudomonadota bacterium]